MINRNNVLAALGTGIIALSLIGVFPMSASSAAQNPASVSGNVPAAPANTALPCIGGTTNTVWGYGAAFGGAALTEWDRCGVVLHSSVPISYANGRGVAVDDDGNLRISALDGTGGGSCGFSGFCGDGLIWTFDQTGFAIATIPDPGGAGGNGIGALDYQGGKLFAMEYLATGGAGGTHTIYRLTPSTGTVEASCTIPDDGSIGSDSLAVLAGRMLTDNGEFDTTLHAYKKPTVAGGGLCTLITSYILPFGPTGIDTPNGSGSLYASDLVDVSKLGTAPYGAVLSSFSTGASNIEDISVDYARG